MKLSKKEYNLQAVRKYRREHPEFCLWNSAKQRAKKYGILFDLKKEDIIIPEKCPVFDVKLEFQIGKGSGPSNWSPTIDRIDNEQGYTKNNIQIISWKANVMKHGASKEELQRFAKWVLQ